jgi:hypothetical protein
MLISRRELLKFVSAASAVAALTPSALAPTTGDHYSNRRLGFELTKPPGWHFLSTVDFYQAARQQRLRSDVSPEIEAVLRSPDAAPFLVVSKYPADSDAPSSAICAYDEARDESFPPSIVQCLEEALSGYARVLSGARTIGDPGAITVPGAEQAASGLWEFNFELQSGLSSPVKAISLLTLRRGRMHTTHFMAVATSAPDDERLLLTSLATVRYRDA